MGFLVLFSPMQNSNCNGKIEFICEVLIRKLVKGKGFYLKKKLLGNIRYEARI